MLLNNRKALIRFFTPLILETIFTTAAPMVLNMMVGTISNSSLTAISMVNTVLAVLNALFALFSTGTGVLVARQIGASDPVDAANVAEQSILFSTVSCTLFSLLCIVCASPLLRLFMPTAEQQLLDEGVLYLRLMLVSFPFLTMQNVITGILRGTGNSRTPMIFNMGSNVLLLLLAYILINRMGLGVWGAGMPYIIARVICAGLLLILLCKTHNSLPFRPRNMLRPRFSVLKRLLRMGASISVEGILVQLGYLVAGSLTVGLGTQNATIYNVASSVYSFGNIPANICMAAIPAITGQYLGAKDVRKARSCVWITWAVSITTCFLIAFGSALFGEKMCSLYSSDPEVIQQSARLLWLLIPVNLMAHTINSVDPGLRAGGDSPYVMWSSTVGVWCIRIPLTYLFCYVMDLSVFGIFLANGISFIYRIVRGVWRLHGVKWIHEAM